MSKKAIYYEEARRLYVTQGFGLTTIEGMIDNKVSRRQLYNWKEDGRWDEKRKRYLEETDSLYDLLLENVKTCAKRAVENPNPKNQLALVRALSAISQKDALSILDDGAGKKEGSTDREQLLADVINKVQEIMEG